MPTRQRWKFAEDDLARIFGTCRRSLSGSNDKHGRDDSLHEVLFLESKFSKSHAVWSLFKDTKEKAKAEGRVPVIGLKQAKERGVLVVIHEKDLEKVFEEYVKAREHREAHAEHQRNLRKAKKERKAAQQPVAKKPPRPIRVCQ